MNGHKISVGSNGNKAEMLNAMAVSFCDDALNNRPWRTFWFQYPNTPGTVRNVRLQYTSVNTISETMRPVNLKLRPR